MLKRSKRINADHLRFQVVFRPEPEGGFTVLVPALPGCITYGKTLERAQRMAEDAITAYVEDMIADGEPIPASDESLLGSIEVKVLKKPDPVHELRRLRKERERKLPSF